MPRQVCRPGHAQRCSVERTSSPSGRRRGLGAAQHVGVGLVRFGRRRRAERQDDGGERARFEGENLGLVVIGARMIIQDRAAPSRDHEAAVPTGTGRTTRRPGHRGGRGIRRTGRG